MLHRRMLMKEQVNDVKKWMVLEDTICEEEMKWDKEYPPVYDEYICYIEIPKMEETISTGNSMVFGNGVLYYQTIGNKAYKTDVFVHIQKIADSFVIGKSGSSPIYGLTGGIDWKTRRQNEDFASHRITITSLPKDTHIWVFAR